MIERRHFISGLTLLFVRPVAVEARTDGRVPRIGYLAIREGPLAERFRQGLRDLGYVEGRNIALEYRWHENHAERRAQQAVELARLGVNLIVAVGPDAVNDALRASSTIPIVMFYSADPILMGWVQNLARPGGNLTGFAWDAGFEYIGKNLEILREALPQANRLAILWNSNNPSHPPYLRAYKNFGSRLSVVIVSLPTSHPDDFDRAFVRSKQEQVHAVVIFPDPLTVTHRREIMALVSRYRLPAMVAGDYTFEGALLSYGPYVADQPQRAAVYVDRILKGAHPGELPIEQPTKYKLVVSVKTAKALGLSIPPSLLLRADDVIE